ncbi:MAG: 3-hydroxyacyl-CoA dehydrogenase NAD-binding domain-containing protein [Hyphomicrobiaceae bacterium]
MSQDDTPRDGLQLHDWRFSVDREGIAWAIFDRAGESANSLGRRPIEELNVLVDHVAQQARAGVVRGLIFMSGKERNFIVGADIREFDSLDTEAKVVEAVRPVDAMLDKIETLPVPAIAAIHGACVGGGFELVLACHYRIATRDETTRVGFPEVKLGLFPGFNGTVRSIRQAGAVAAMQNMLTGAMISAAAARAQGFVDELVDSPHRLRWAARKAVRDKRRSPAASGFKTLLRMQPIRPLLAKKFRMETAKKVREDHYPAPFRLIDLFETYAGDLTRMAEAETRLFAPLMVSETSRNLRRVFRLSELLKAQAPKDLPWRPLRVHVIGAGTMGADIAGWCAAAGLEVSLQDLSDRQIQKGILAQDALLRRRFKTKASRDAAKLRLIADPGGEHIPRADVVVEAIVEKLDLKQELFATVLPKLKPGALLATNTSSLMIEDIAKPLADPGRLVGLHFFNPVGRMPLVEIVRGAGSRDDEVAKGAAFAAALGKLPLIVRSVPGFLVNRVLAPYLKDALQRLDNGTPKEKLDEAARTFGMPMGPIELADSVGLDVCAHVGKILQFGGEGSQLHSLVERGKLGKKTGEGFYLWRDDKPQKTTAQYDKAELETLGRELVEPLIRESERCRDEHVVETADLVDAGVVFGTGFAPFRGGPLHFRGQGAGRRDRESRISASVLPSDMRAPGP